MKKILFILSIAASVFATSCTKEIVNDTDNGMGSVLYNSGRTVLNLGIPEATKVNMGAAGSRVLTWSTGDQLAWNGTASVALGEAYNGQSSAQFVWNGVMNRPADILYPAGFYKDETTISLPATQTMTGDADNLADNAFPLAGTIDESGNVTINRLCAVVRLQITGSDANNIKSVRFSGNNDEQICGDFTIDYTAGTLTGKAAGDVTSADKAITVTCDKTLEAGSDKYVNIVVPAGEYSKGFNVIITDSDGNTKTKFKNSSSTLTVGRITSFPELNFGSKAKVTISNATEFNAFATAYNNGEYIDQVEAEITGDLDFDGMDVVTVGNYDRHVYFDGKIIGNNHVIKNLHSSNTLVGSLDSDGSISNLTIDETCAYTVSYTPGTQKHFGPFTEYAKGTLTNCVNKADITLSGNGSDNDKTIYIGGIAGRVREGKFEECVNYGDITLDNTYKGTSNTVYAYAGGIVGWMSNAAGVAENCTNSGTLSTEAWCNTVALGGIAGLTSATIKDCTNNGVLTSTFASRPTSDACKFTLLGGIAGDAAKGCKLTGNTSEGAITASSAVKQIFIGGIAARISGVPGSISANTSSSVITSTGGVRNAFYGGLYGQVNAATTLALTDSPFTGSIAISGPEQGNTSDWTKVYTRIFAGGVVGCASAALTITGTTCSFKSNITITGETMRGMELYMGGVVGGAGTDGVGTTKSGAKVTISGISVSGNVKMTGTSPIIPQYKESGMGGIIGGALCGADISSCSSASSVYFCDASTASGSNGCPAHLGGIAGRIEGANSSVTNCTATSKCKVYNYLYNNNWWNANNQVGINACGGILGSFGYDKGNTFTLTLSGCESEAACYGFRGTAGGIAGYIDHATISGENSYKGLISRGAPAAGVAGISNNSTISGCTVNSTQIKGNGAGSCIGHTAGIVGLGMSTSVSGCKSYVAAMPASGGTGVVAGGIIACPDNGCSINNCSYGGQVNGTAISSSNVGSYIIGNSEMTPGTVTYWDGN